MDHPTHAPRRLIHEPLVHFLALAGLIFLAHWVLAEPEAQPVIRIDTAELEEFRQSFQQRHFRAPTTEELDRFRDNRISEEVLYREGLALGLDLHDPVIKARVISKMQLILADQQPVSDPGDDALLNEMEKHAERYRLEPRYSFDLIRLAGLDPGYQASLMSALNSGADPAMAGVTPVTFKDTNTAALRASFPSGFVRTLDKTRNNESWQRIAIADQPALIRVTQYHPPRLPALEDIRSRVLADWRKTQRARQVESRVAAMQSSYTIQR